MPQGFLPASSGVYRGTVFIPPQGQGGEERGSTSKLLVMSMLLLVALLLFVGRASHAYPFIMYTDLVPFIQLLERSNISKTEQMVVVRNAEQMNLRYLVNAKPNPIPIAHQNYLLKLKQEQHMEPAVVFDIGSSLVHWTHIAYDLWPSAEYYLFDAFEEVSQIYSELEASNWNFHYHIGLLSNETGRTVEWYQNSFSPRGNSYFKELTDIYASATPKLRWFSHI